ncbi:hypothetical protein BSKO_01828 [Bryopsis sp. KO-2023]|nr:hypothetical protein BSKO_01828 [Bryopsis sp. KO-2023]
MCRGRLTKVLLSCVFSLITLCVGKEDVKLNEIQVLHSHNSFHVAPNADLLDLLKSPVVQSALLDPGLLGSIQSLEYSHVSLTEQLKKFGVRSFELDVFYDPEGGLFASRAGAKLAGLNGTSDDPAWKEPGYKVFHIPDLDFETTCVGLQSCLTEIRTWSEENPDHIPITIYIEPQSFDTEKALGQDGTSLVETLLQVQEGEPRKLATTLPINTKAFEALKEEILEALDSSQLITPDELTKNSGSLKEVIIDAGNWPTVSELRGRIVIVISPPFTDELLRIYPNLKGSPFFPSAFKQSINEHTLFVFPDALAPTLTGNVSTWDEQIEVLVADVQGFVEQGYIVRAFTDSFSLEARDNFTARSTAIAAAGAHFLSTDFPGGRTPTLFDSNYTVELKNAASAVCNPVTAPSTCKSSSLAEKSVQKQRKKNRKKPEADSVQPDSSKDSEKDEVSVTSSPAPPEIQLSLGWSSTPRQILVHWIFSIGALIFFVV